MTAMTMMMMKMMMKVHSNDSDLFLSAFVNVVEIFGDVLVVVKDVFQVLNVIRVSTERRRRTKLELPRLEIEHYQDKINNINEISWAILTNGHTGHEPGAPRCCFRGFLP